MLKILIIGSNVIILILGAIIDRNIRIIVLSAFLTFIINNQIENYVKKRDNQ